MIRIPGKIPISIYPMFWLMAILIGFLLSATVAFAFVWVAIIFFSVLFHEFGHALTALFFGKKPHIELVALGGLTYHDSEKLALWKQFLITLNGPLFGLLLFFLSSFLYGLYPTGVVGAIFQSCALINLFWALLNLLPVLPMDGGQLLRIVLQGLFGMKGFNYALLFSVALSLIFSLASFLFNQLFIGALFFLFAFQNFESYRRLRKMVDVDRKENIKEALEKAEQLLEAGKKDEALVQFEKIAQETKAGISFLTASQYLACLYLERGESKRAYDLLLPLRKELSDEALLALHRAAFDLKHYPLVAELAGTCFQTRPAADIALCNATACMSLGQSESAIGWLKTAKSEGLDNLDEVLASSLFAPIRDAMRKIE